MRGDAHVRFGERAEETDRTHPRHRASARLYTCIETTESWLYLAGVKDLFNGEMVGYSMAERMTCGLVETALRRAIDANRPESRLIHYSVSRECAGGYRH